MTDEAGGDVLNGQALFEQALFEEAAKKSALLWVAPPGGTRRPVWHLWHTGAVLVVGDGPGEQPLHGLPDAQTATVTVRSKDKGGRLLSRTVRVLRVPPGGEAWQEAVGQLRGKRLNAPDYPDVPERWARECVLLRLEPEPPDAAAGEEAAGSETAEAASTGMEAAVPLASPATTRVPRPPSLPRAVLRRRRPRGGT